MSASESIAPDLQPLVGQQVVIDVSGPFVYIGTLRDIGAHSITLVEADVHDLRETSTSTDRYLIETHKHGIRINRHRVDVLCRNIISVSPLDAIVTY